MDSTRKACAGCATTRSFAAEGKTVLVSSHVLAEVQQSVDQVVIINKGKLAAFEPLAQLTTHMSGGVRVRAPVRTDCRRNWPPRDPIVVARR